MSKRWLIILLLVSFSFNLAVVGSIIYLRLTVPCPPPYHSTGRPQMMPPQHMQAFLGNDDEIRHLRNKFDSTKVNLMQELAKDPINNQKVSEIIDSSLVAQNELERRLGQKIVAYRKTMTPEEARVHFLQRAENMENRSHKFMKYRNRRKP